MNLLKIIDSALTAVGTPFYYGGKAAAITAKVTGKAVSPTNIKRHGGNVTLALACTSGAGLFVNAKLQAADNPFIVHDNEVVKLLMPELPEKTFSTNKQVKIGSTPQSYFNTVSHETHDQEPLPYYTAEDVPPSVNAVAGESVSDLVMRSGPVLTDDNCMQLRDGKVFCTSDVWLTSMRDPLPILERQSEYVDYLLELEKKKNLPKGMLVVMTLIESQLGENMGKNGCSITGKHCGYHQASPEFAKQAGYKPADRFDKKKSAEIAVKMAYVYLKEDKTYYEGMGLTTTDSYLRHQQGTAGWNTIEKTVTQGESALTDKERKLVRLQTAYNLPLPWANGYVDTFKRKNGKTGKRLKSGVTAQEAAELFHYGWQNEIMRLSRIVEAHKKEKLINLYGEANWQIAKADIG